MKLHGKCAVNSGQLANEPKKMAKPHTYIVHSKCARDISDAVESESQQI